MLARENVTDATNDLRPLPPLALSFALFGAAAGFFAVLALGSLNFGSRLIHPGLAAACSGASGALYGALLRRSRAVRNPFSARENVLIRLGVGLAASGALAGLAIGSLTIVWRPNGLGAQTVTASAVVGAIIGVLLLPACSAVFGAALRATRARPGSVVSRADRGRVKLTLFATMSLLSLGGVPPVALDASSHFLGPELQLLLSVLAPVVCLGAILWSSFRTKHAARQFDELARRREECAPSEATDSRAEVVSDLGLGDERWSRVRLNHAYRGTRDASVVLRGNVDDARHAIRETASSGRGAISLAIAMTTLVALSAVGAMLFSKRSPMPTLGETNLGPVSLPASTMRSMWAAQWPLPYRAHATRVDVSDGPLAGALQGSSLRRASPNQKPRREHSGCTSYSPCEDLVDLR